MNRSALQWTVAMSCLAISAALVPCDVDKVLKIRCQTCHGSETHDPVRDELPVVE